MVVNSSVTFSDPRLLTGLFSNAAFRSLCSGGSKQGKFLEVLIELVGPSAKGLCLKDLLNQGFRELLQGYRHEYLFKSALFNDFVLRNYSLDNSILLNEFQIATSIADVVLVNGANKVFEIKTELDSPKRLDVQIQDYKKAFSEVYIVVHETQAGKYAKIVPQEIGILCLSGEDTTHEWRPASLDISQLDVEVMAKCLRKDELGQLVVSLEGELPDATPVKWFKTCLDRVSVHAPTKVQKEYLEIIKGRINPTLNQKILSDRTPAWLKFFCYSENIKEKDYIHLLNSLDITF